MKTESYVSSLSPYTSITDKIFARLFKQYKDKAKRLYKTGEGIGDPSQANGTTDEYASHYVGAEGPDQFTPPDISNIWGKL